MKENWELVRGAQDKTDQLLMADLKGTASWAVTADG